MKNYYLALMVSALLTINVYAEDVEEVIVTASLTNQTVSDLKDPLHVVDGEDVTAGGVQSLGDTLDELLGVHSADFGAAVGQPVIRGMSGSRVRVLENGVVVRDVAALGPDHINDVNLLNTQQIEVVRGPSSLLYANGGAGGVIQVVHELASNFSTTSTSFVDVTGCTVTITPKFATSKFLVRANISATASNSGNGILLNGTTTGSLLEPTGYSSRGRSAAGELYAPGGSTDTFQSFSVEVLDSPGTTATQTYKAQVFVRNNGNTVYINRSINDNDDAGKARGCSTITVMEVSA